MEIKPFFKVDSIKTFKFINGIKIYPIINQPAQFLEQPKPQKYQSLPMDCFSQLKSTLTIKF